MSDPSPPSDSSSSRRWLLAGLLALVPIVPIVAALLLTGAGGSGASASASAASAQSSAATASAQSKRPVASALPGGPGTLVGIIERPTAMSRTPGGRRVATLPTKTGFGSPESVSVRRVKGRWLGVVNVAAGNNHLGWIHEGSGVALTRVDWTVRAHLASHQLAVYHGAKLAVRYTIADGKPSAPTPTGDFAVTDRLRTGDAEGPYGCCIIALSAKAPHAISDWDGGNRIAVHATPATSTIGESVSHGCMHVTNAEGQWLITHVPLGTPVIVSSA